MIMEDHSLLSFPFLLSFVLLIFLTLKVSKRLTNSGTKSNLPPGPWKLPIFGSVHHLISPLPHHRLRELSQKYGPLMHLQLGETSAMVVSSAELAKDVLKTNEITFANRPRWPSAEILAYGCTNISFSPYGDYWRQLRKICTLELLSAKRTRSFQPIREEEMSNLIRDISMNIGYSINLTDKILTSVYRIVTRAAFGDECKEDQEAYVSFIKKMMSFSEVLGVTNLFPSQKWLHSITGLANKMEEMHRTSDMFVDNIIKAAMAKIGEDASLVSILLNLQDQGEFHLTNNSIKAVIQGHVYCWI